LVPATDGAVRRSSRFPLRPQGDGHEFYAGENAESHRNPDLVILPGHPQTERINQPELRDAAKIAKRRATPRKEC
jgi:hypothetical protein